MICLKMTFQKKLQRLFQRVPTKRKKNRHKYQNQQAHLRKHTNHQKSGNKLFLKCDYYTHKYREKNGVPEDHKMLNNTDR